MHNMMQPLIYVLAFVAVVVLVQAACSILFSSRDRSRRLNRRLTMLESGMKHDEVYAALIRDTAPPRVDLLGIHQRLRTYCRQAGLSVSPTRLLITVASVATLLWLASFMLLGAGGESGIAVNGIVSLLASWALSVSGAWFWVTRKRHARLKKIEDQMPLALDIINRGLRAGHPVVSAVQLAANEMGDPIGTEFGLIVDETSYGLEFKDALTNFARRTGSPDAHFFAVSVGIQSQTGGNLAEILAGLASVIRGRCTLAKRVKALASEGRASAYVLSALPPMLVSFIALTQPSFYSSKFSDPIFWPTVVFICALYLLGWVMIHRIINFKV
jgi:tight adherence protein B